MLHVRVCVGRRASFPESDVSPADRTGLYFVYDASPHFANPLSNPPSCPPPSIILARNSAVSSIHTNTGNTLTASYLLLFLSNAPLPTARSSSFNSCIAETRCRIQFELCHSRNVGAVEVFFHYSSYCRKLSPVQFQLVCLFSNRVECGCQGVNML